MVVFRNSCPVFRCGMKEGLHSSWHKLSCCVWRAPLLWLRAFRKIYNLERQIWEKTRVTHGAAKGTGSASRCRAGVHRGAVRDYLAGTDCAFKQITGWAEQRARAARALLRAPPSASDPHGPEAHLSLTQSDRPDRSKPSNEFRSLSKTRTSRIQRQRDGIRDSLSK